VESLELGEGRQGEVSVTVADVPGEGVMSFQGGLSFDPEVIEIIRVEFPDNFPVKAFEVEGAEVRFAATAKRGEGAPLKEGELFRLIVRAVGPPESSTTLEPVFQIFHDIDFNPIAHQVIPGTITITPAVNEPPTADFDYRPTVPSTRDTIRFIDRSSDPDGRITQWLWDFGDGITAETQTASHKYAQGGTYTVTLTVTDDRGASDTISKRIFVFQAPPLGEAAALNFPNPARTYTTFLYFLPEGSQAATLLIFDLVGRLVLERRLDVAGRELRWDLRDDRGSDLPNGPYFYLVRAVTQRGVVRSRVEVLVIQR